jgi:hypothetical protein
MISRLRFLAVSAALLFCAPVGIARQHSSGDVTLTGQEAAAVRLAVDDFLRHRYSASGDLTRYTLKLHRDTEKIEVDFIPDTDSRGPYPGGRTDHGREVYYTVSLKPLKILSSLFGQ